MQKISFDEFADLLRRVIEKGCSSCKKQIFLNWENITPEIDNLLVVAGEFERAEEFISKNGYNEYQPQGTNYWSQDAPFALQYFPYHESTIRICPVCGAVFLSYTEYAGHAPQKRLRWVRSDLVYYGE